MPGGNYGFVSADGSRTWQADRRLGLTTQEAPIQLRRSKRWVEIARGVRRLAARLARM